MTQGVSIHQRTAGILRIESYPLPRVIHEGRTQRSLSVWQRQEVQEVLPCQGPGGAVGATGPESASAFVSCATSPGFLPHTAASEACPANRTGTRRGTSKTSPAARSDRRERRESLAGVRVPERRGPDRRLPRDPGRRRGDDGRHGLRDAQHPPLRGCEGRRPRALRGVRRRTPRATARGVRSGCSLLSVLVPGGRPGGGPAGARPRPGAGTGRPGRAPDRHLQPDQGGPGLSRPARRSRRGRAHRMAIGEILPRHHSLGNLGVRGGWGHSRGLRLPRTHGVSRSGRCGLARTRPFLHREPARGLSERLHRRSDGNVRAGVAGGRLRPEAGAEKRP